MLPGRIDVFFGGGIAILPLYIALDVLIAKPTRTCGSGNPGNRRACDRSRRVWPGVDQVW